MLIGEVVRQSGVSHDTIRYYEKMGLLRTEGRSSPANTYKVYTADTITRLAIIQQGKKLGFSLTEIAEGLELLYSEQLSGVMAEDRLWGKLSVIDDKIKALQSLRHRLVFVLEQVQTGKCSIQLPNAERHWARGGDDMPTTDQDIGGGAGVNKRSPEPSASGTGLLA